jgi:predicted RNase H-like HicB family nuclease
MAEVNYLVVIEKGPKSFGAYVPDLPGLGVVGRSVAEVKRLVEEAIQFHIEGLLEDGLPIPRPKAHHYEVAIPRMWSRRAGRVPRKPSATSDPGGARRRPVSR